MRCVCSTLRRFSASYAASWRDISSSSAPMSSTAFCISGPTSASFSLRMTSSMRACSACSRVSSASSYCSIVSRSLHSNSSFMPFSFSFSRFAHTDVSSCLRMFCFSILIFSPSSSWLSCLAFLSRFFSFSYVCSTYSWSCPYFCLYMSTTALVSLPSAASSSRKL